MKILYNTYPMAFHTPGGGEIQLQRYFDYLKLNNYDVELFDLWNPNLDKFDILHFFSCISGSQHFTNFVSNLGKLIVVTPNLWVTHETKNQYPFGEIKEQFRIANIIIVNSNAEGDLLSDVFETSRQKFKTVYNGVEDYFFNLVEAKLFRETYNISDKFILNVANIEPRKNQLKFIQALKMFPELKLVIIGHERDKEYAKQCFELGGEQVIYIGPLKHDSKILRSAYSACEFFALPSIVETPGLAALEAAASNAKILITKDGCTDEYFKNKAIYLDPNCIESMQRGIDEILKIKPQKLSSFVENNFSWKKVLSSLEKIYQDGFKELKVQK